MPRKLTREEFIEKARAVHGDRYGYDQVEYQGNIIPVRIVCPIHGVFEQTPGAHVTQKQNCPVCSDRKPLGLEGFIERARKVHGDKYDYSAVDYVNNKTPIEIICKEHGSFIQTPHNHLKNRGCPKCAKNHKLSQDEFIRRATLRHKGFYDYSQTVYIKNAAKIKIICPLHGMFEQEANSHLMGVGCPICGKIKIGNSDYSGRSETRKQTVRKKYGVDNVMQDAVMREKCWKTKKENHTFHTSAPEERLYEMLASMMNQKVLRQHNTKQYPFACDFYIPERDLYIELNAHWTHGGSWFDPQKSEHQEQLEEWKNGSEYYQNAAFVWATMDVRKRECAKKNHLNYIVFWDTDLRDVDVWFAMGCPDGKDWDKIYSYYPKRMFTSQKPQKCKTKNDVSRLVRHYQHDVFYERELAMWDENPYYHKQMGLQAWLYANRLQYTQKTPYELTDAEVLRGFKIAGIIEGYTVFDPELMQQTIEKYDIQSIYDPCAGWGERLFTCYLAGVRYHGYDINEQLECGYKQMITDFRMKNQMFRVCDSTKICQKKSCDVVLTCPPYFNRERYTSVGAENLSYDEFLRWWKKTVERSLQVNPKYFCFQINQKYKQAMAEIIESCGFALIDELSAAIRSSHFTRLGGENRKKEYESMLVFQRVI